MTDEPIERARSLAERLRAEGHEAAAEQVTAAAASPPHEGNLLLHGLREALDVVLTAIEAIDPATMMMAEELRTEIERRLS